MEVQFVISGCLSVENPPNSFGSITCKKCLFVELSLWCVMLTRDAN